MKNSKTLFLKYTLQHGIPFGLFLSIWDYIDHGNIDLIKFLLHSLLFGISMAFYSLFMLESELSKRGVASLSLKEINHLNNFSKIELLDFSSIKEKIQNGLQDKNIKMVHKGDTIVIKSKSIFKTWGDPIIISPSQEAEYLDIKPKLWVLSPETNTYLNALNIKRIMEIMEDPKGE